MFDHFLSLLAFEDVFPIFSFKFFFILPYLKVWTGIFLVSSKYKQEGFTDNICFWPGLRNKAQYGNVFKRNLVKKLKSLLTKWRKFSNWKTYWHTNSSQKCFKLFNFQFNSFILFCNAACLSSSELNANIVLPGLRYSVAL